MTRTDLPSFRRAALKAAPMNPAAPVTSTVFPFRSCVIVHLQKNSGSLDPFLTESVSHDFSASVNQIIPSILQINIHRLSRWFFNCGHSPALKAAPYSAYVVCACTLSLCSRKRVLKLHLQLLCFLVFLQLVPDILFDLLRVLPDRVHIVSTAPE